MADSPLQKVPVGLLDALALKTLGTNPVLFGELVRGGVELLDMYLAQRLSTLTSSGAAGAFPLSFTFTPVFAFPMRVWGVTPIVVTGAAGGTRLELQLNIDAPVGGNPSHVLQFEQLTPRAGAGFASPWIPPYPLICPSGTTFSMGAVSDAAGADHTPTITMLVQFLGTSDL